MRDAIAVLGSDPTLILCEDEDGNDVCICMHVFGKGLRNQQRPTPDHCKSIEQHFLLQGELRIQS